MAGHGTLAYRREMDGLRAVAALVVVLHADSGSPGNACWRAASSEADGKVKLADL